MGLVDRYGSAIEADLHAVYGLDLLDFFRGKHPWGKLARLLGHLREGTSFRTAQARDEELARALARDTRKPKASGLPLSEMGTTNQLLVANLDALSVLLMRVEQALGMKPPKFKPVAVEHPALTRVREQVEQEHFDSLLAEAEEAQRRNK